MKHTVKVKMTIRIPTAPYAFAELEAEVDKTLEGEWTDSDLASQVGYLVDSLTQVVDVQKATLEGKWGEKGNGTVSVVTDPPTPRPLPPNPHNSPQGETYKREWNTSPMRPIQDGETLRFGFTGEWVPSDADFNGARDTYFTVIARYIRATKYGLALATSDNRKDEIAFMPRSWGDSYDEMKHHIESLVDGDLPENGVAALPQPLVVHVKRTRKDDRTYNNINGGTSGVVRLSDTDYKKPS